VLTKGALHIHCMIQAASQLASAGVHSSRPWWRSRRSCRNRKYLYAHKYIKLPFQLDLPIFQSYPRL